MALFGSVVRDDFRQDSDIDILVEFERGHVPGLAFFGLQDELSELFGRPVDLNTPGCFRPRIRRRIAAEAEVIYGPAKRSRAPAPHARIRPNRAKAVAPSKAGRPGHRGTVELGMARLLEVIGEAASRVSKACREKHADIPWRLIIGMRNRLIHGYDTISRDITWQVLTQDLRPLIQSLNKILRALPKPRRKGKNKG
jgi:predicted nucleotidyltransferase/uncharacterized protein with HEPN domain